MGKYFIVCYAEQNSNGQWDYINIKLDKDPIDWLKLKRASLAFANPNSIALVSFQEISKKNYDEIVLPIM